MELKEETLYEASKRVNRELRQQLADTEAKLAEVTAERDKAHMALGQYVSNKTCEMAESLAIRELSEKIFTLEKELAEVDKKK